MNTPRDGNRIILLSLAIAIAVASLFVQWGVMTVTADDLRGNVTVNGHKLSTEGFGGLFEGMISSMLSGASAAVSGLNGILTLGSLRIPYWLGIAAVLVGLLLTMTNLIRFSAIPKTLIVALLASGLVTGVWASVAILNRGSLGVGALLLIGASVIGLVQQRSS